MAERKIWPQPALGKLNVEILWSGNPNHLASLRITIEVLCLPNSRLSLIDTSSPSVLSAHVVAIKYLDNHQPEGRDNALLHHLPMASGEYDGDEDNDEYSSSRQRPRALYTPPASVSPVRDNCPRTVVSKKANGDVGLISDHEGCRRKTSRTRKASETSSGTKVVPIQRGPPTDSTAEISPASFSYGGESEYERSSTPTPSLLHGIEINKRPKPSHLDRKLFRMKKHETRIPRKAKTAESCHKPSWHRPGAGDTIFPPSKNVVSTLPRRVSRSLGPKPLGAARTIGRADARRPRSSSIESPGRRNLTMKKSILPNVVHWIDNTKGAWSSDDEEDVMSGYKIVDEQSGEDGVDLHASNSLCLLDTTDLLSSSPSQLNDSFLADHPSVPFRQGRSRPHLRGGGRGIDASLGDRSASLVKVGGRSWLKFGSDVEESTLTVAIEAEIALVEHQAGGYVLRIPGLPQQTTYVEGTYSIEISNPEEYSIPNGVIAQEKVRLVMENSVTERLDIGRIGGFSLQENFALRFLCKAQQHVFKGDEFDIEYDVQQTPSKSSPNPGVELQPVPVKDVLSCRLKSESLIWWAETLQFTIYVSGSPLAEDVTHTLGKEPRDRVIELGVSDQQCEEDRAITLTTPGESLCTTFWISWSEEVDAETKRPRALPRVTTTKRAPISAFPQLIGLGLFSYPDGNSESEDQREALGAATESLSDHDSGLDEGKHVRQTTRYWSKAVRILALSILLVSLVWSGMPGNTGRKYAESGLRTIYEIYEGNGMLNWDLVERFGERFELGSNALTYGDVTGWRHVSDWWKSERVKATGEAAQKKRQEKNLGETEEQQWEGTGIADNDSTENRPEPFPTVVLDVDDSPLSTSDGSDPTEEAHSTNPPEQPDTANPKTTDDDTLSESTDMESQFAFHQYLPKQSPSPASVRAPRWTPVGWRDRVDSVLGWRPSAAAAG